MAKEVKPNTTVTTPGGQKATVVAVNNGKAEVQIQGSDNRQNIPVNDLR